jgi:2Fe-2S ferredoxin
VVNDTWFGIVGKPSEQEESMLDLNPDREANSRLSCQIEVTDELDGLVVQLPQFQY